MSKIYIAGVYEGEGKKSAEWHVLGAFMEENRAVSACTKTNHFVAPLEIDERLPEEVYDWPGCYYPLQKKEQKEKDQVQRNKCGYNDPSCGYWEVSGACTIDEKYTCKHEKEPENRSIRARIRAMAGVITELIEPQCEAIWATGYLAGEKNAIKESK